MDQALFLRAFFFFFKHLHKSCEAGSSISELHMKLKHKDGN